MAGPEPTTAIERHQTEPSDPIRIGLIASCGSTRQMNTHPANDGSRTGDLALPHLAQYSFEFAGR